MRMWSFLVLSTTPVDVPGWFLFFDLILLALLYQFRKNCGGGERMGELFWVEMEWHVNV